MDGFPSDGVYDNNHLGTSMPFRAPFTPSLADNAASGSNRPKGDKLSCAPHLCSATCFAAAAFANSADSPSEVPVATFAASAPTKQSPAPWDDTTLTGLADSAEVVPSADLRMRPSPPSVTMTFLILAPILDSADAASVGFRIGSPDSISASIRFTTRQSIRSS